jgi:hypothetical protein
VLVASHGEGGGEGPSCERAAPATPAPPSQLDLEDGKHTLVVQATDQFGLVEEPPLLMAFTLDTVPPQCEVEVVTPSPSNSDTMLAQFTCFGA